MKSLEENILHTINFYQLIENEDKLVLAVSGGPDSMCMLKVLENLLKEKLILKNKQEEELAEKNCQKGPSPMAHFYK